MCNRKAEKQYKSNVSRGQLSEIPQRYEELNDINLKSLKNNNIPIESLTIDKIS